MEPTPKDPTVKNLEALGGMAADVDKDNQGPEAKAKQQQDSQAADAAIVASREWGMLPYTLGGLVVMIEPQLRGVYTEERCLDWGRHMHAVAKKYGWDTPSNIPELGLVACSISFVLPTVILVRQRIKAIKEGKEAGLLSRVVMWWQLRKAAKAAAAAPGAPAETGQGANDGGQQ